ncbi:elongation factor P [Marinivivus vitaminiproducens]|uniref:elongation factor P n=1 Tax=Marinivivus vitaminiproducens TaxID=3035935 RepID=UPI0027A1E54E|nr:elongation factor P [Geminicoccaceae bacterium SCSIO 64248]
MAKINGNEIRPGYVLEYKGKLWSAVKTEHVKPGKGPAYMQVELKDLVDGTKLNERFRAAETVERVRLEQRAFQFLYDEGTTLAFMDQESFEQIAIDKSLIGDRLPFLQEGMVIQVESHEGRPLGVQLPETVVLTVVEADPVVKGQTATSSYKPAVADNGVRVMVPPHIESGTKIVVNTADSTYIERFKG